MGSAAGAGEPFLGRPGDWSLCAGARPAVAWVALAPERASTAQPIQADVTPTEHYAAADN